jgi:hypothetical protein
MGTTPSGLPWPEGTELVRDGDNAIRALAEAVEARIWSTGSWPKARFMSGAYSTGSDGRVWIATPGITSANGGTGSIAGSEKWIVRPVQYSGTNVLWEVCTLTGALVLNTAMNFNLVVWGN